MVGIGRKKKSKEEKLIKKVSGYFNAAEKREIEDYVSEHIGLNEAILVRQTVMAEVRRNKKK